ncbi:MAG TPA: hypothetical protein DIW47_10650 [Bacteroidetes bacterium]|nr:hypothetical protein [Bacteroidota bacterium]
MTSTESYHWYAFGVSHKKADFRLRTKFSLSQEEIIHYYEDVFIPGSCKGFILTTCNRTSFFLRGPHPKTIEAYFASQKALSMEEYAAVSYHFEGREAIQHFFEVAAGLDSQIPGDFEIIGQMKKATCLAKTHGVLNGEIEKLMNAATYASRRIKNETDFSSGTSSVSYAAVRLLKDELADFKRSKLLILGLGDIGRQVIENLLKHKAAETIWVANRSEEKSLLFAREYGVRVLAFDSWKFALADFDALVNAASSPGLLLDDEEIEKTSAPALFLDLAMPAALGNARGNKRVFHVDEISAYVLGNISKRCKEIPKAQGIVAEEINEFYAWQTARLASPYVNAIGAEFERRHSDKQLVNSASFYQRKRLEARLFQSIKEDPQKLSWLKLWITNSVA